MLKVCVVGVYFGKLPNYFNLWLRSAEANPTVDFKVFTDAQYEDLPQNVCFVNFSLNQMRELASAKLGFEVCLERPYKCCDFKPVYGLIFEEYLKEYDYWGHCDFDLIWGDLRGFFDLYHLEQYDKFLPLGHFCLYQNTSENNHRFMLKGSDVPYKTVYTDTRNFAFDEIGGIYQIFKKNKLSMFDRRIFADISEIYHRYCLACDDKNYNYQVFCWDKGHVYRYYYDEGIKRDEFIYIHFKSRGALPVEAGCEQSSSFYITNHGFFSCDTNKIDKAMMQKYNHFESLSVEKKERRRYSWMEFKQSIILKIKRFFHMKENLR